MASSKLIFVGVMFHVTQVLSNPSVFDFEVLDFTLVEWLVFRCGITQQEQNFDVSQLWDVFVSRTVINK